MPWEHIGNCGYAQVPHEREWMECCMELGIVYLRHVCGDPPPGCEIDIMWHEHEFGNYATIGLLWGDPQTDVPWEYVNRCETALAAFHEAVSWSEINPTTIQGLFETDKTDKDEEGESS